MSLKDLRKISHPEPKILNSLVNCGRTHAHTHAHTDKCKSRADPTRGGSAKNLNKPYEYIELQHEIGGKVFFVTLLTKLKARTKALS